MVVSKYNILVVSSVEFSIISSTIKKCPFSIKMNYDDDLNTISKLITLLQL